MNLPVRILFLASLSIPARISISQDGYTRRNTFSAFTEYSNNSSHIFLGTAPNRKFAGLGLQYERRLLGHSATWSYFAEVRPLSLRVISQHPTPSLSCRPDRMDRRSQLNP